MNKNRERQCEDTSQIIQYAVERIKRAEEGDTEREYKRSGIALQKVLEKGGF